jgi:dihydroorotase (multifunctional complex type)
MYTIAYSEEARVSDQFDLVVKSDRILADGAWFGGAVAVRDGRIAALVGPGEAADLPAQRTIDAGTGCVIPGLVDTHAHFRDPGYTHKEDITAGTRAAAAGGVTTVFDMPNVDPPTNSAERLRRHLDNAAAKTVIDIGHNASGVIPEHIAELAEGGATAFKVWQMRDIGRDYPHPPGTAVTDDQVLYRIFEEVAGTGLPLYVHPHNQSLYDLFVRRAQQRWGTDFRSYARALRDGDGVVLNTAIAQLLEFQRATGCRLHILHVATREGIELIRRAKDHGRPVTAEANPFAMFLTNSWDLIEQKGPYCLGFWVPEEDNPTMWDAIVDGTIDVVGSDHGPHTREEKEVGWTDMYAAPGGQPMIQHYLQLMLTKVYEGVLTLERVVELASTAPAKLAGYYPRKGTIRVGADADLVIVDMDREEVLSAERALYRCGWASTEGLKTRGAPVVTVQRGRVLYENGTVTADAGSGRVLRPERG